MDLLSLPDEMLASIFKYNGHLTNVELRKTNQKIDKAVKCYIGTRLKVYELKHEVVLKNKKEYSNFLTTSGKIRSKVRSLRSKRERDMFYFKNECKLELFLTAMGAILKRTIIMDKLTISIPQINDDLLDVLYKNQKSLKLTKHLELNSTFNCSPQKAERMFKCFKSLTTLTMEEIVENLISDPKMFRGRKWDSLSFRIRPNGVENFNNNFDDQFLTDVVQYCPRFTIVTSRPDRVNFSIPRIVEAYKAALKSGIMPIWWFEYVSSGNLTRDEIEYLFRDVEEYNLSFYSEQRNAFISRADHRRSYKTYLEIAIIVENE